MGKGVKTLHVCTLRMAQVTLVGERLAEEGREFVYQGEAPGCEGCPYRDTCLNLSVGTKYRIDGVREGAALLECAVHDQGVRAVEVEPAPVRANVPSRVAYAGSSVSLAGSCPYTECPSHEYCEPAGMDFEAERQIADVVGDPPHDHCMLDRDLTLVEMTPENE
jgi:Uncharacterized protein conserved in archaea